MGIFSLELWKPYLFRNEGKVIALVYILDSASAIYLRKVSFFCLIWKVVKRQFQSLLHHPNEKASLVAINFIKCQCEIYLKKKQTSRVFLCQTVELLINIASQNDMVIDLCNLIVLLPMTTIMVFWRSLNQIILLQTQSI